MMTRKAASCKAGLSQNAKNILQELVQQRGCDLPHYETAMVGKQWQSQVQTKLHPAGIQGECCSSKTKAEISAASAMLKLIETPEKKPVLLPPSYFAELVKHRAQKVAILVDYENQPSALSQLEKMGAATTTFTVYIFLSKHNARAAHPFPDWVHVILVESLAKDAADTAMIGFAAIWTQQKIYDVFVFVSVDKFIIPLRDLLENGQFGASPKVMMTAAHLLQTTLAALNMGAQN